MLVISQDARTPRRSLRSVPVLTEVQMRPLLALIALCMLAVPAMACDGIDGGGVFYQQQAVYQPQAVAFAPSYTVAAAPVVYEQPQQVVLAAPAPVYRAPRVFAPSVGCATCGGAALAPRAAVYAPSAVVVNAAPRGRFFGGGGGRFVNRNVTRGRGVAGAQAAAALSIR